MIRYSDRIPEVRYATIGFIDVSGSTETAEVLNNDTYFFNLLNRWQRLTSFILCNMGGSIGASDSDCVMGYFTGVETETLGSSRAILSAKKIRDETVRFSQELKISLDVHIGIHCGNVEVVEIGPELRRNSTVIGSPVNIASRIKDKAIRGEILISEQLKKDARIFWQGDCAGEYSLKGVARPMKCYRVQSVGFSSIPKEALSQSEWIFAVLEAQALEQIGKYDESLEFARKANEAPNALTGLKSKLILMPPEICIWDLFYLNKLKEAEEFIRRYAECATELSDQLECANVDYYRAWSLMLQGKWHEAITFFWKAKQGYESCGQRKRIADSLFYSGKCLEDLGDPKATELFEEAKKEYQYFIDNQDGNDADIGKACLELSSLLVKDRDLVMHYLALAIEKFEETCQFRFLIRALTNMSYVCNSIGRPTDAESFARQALELALDFDPVHGAMAAYENIGASIETRCHFGGIRRGDVQKALIESRQNYQKVFDLAKELGLGDLCKKMIENINRIDQSCSILSKG